MKEMADGIAEYLQRLAGYNPTVTIVQLLLIGLMVYLIMRFMKGTRGAGLIKRAAVLLAAIFFGIRVLPSQDEWQRIGFLFAGFLWFVVFAFIVAFQPELRRVLISIGQAKIFRRHHSTMMSLVDDVIKSISIMSRKKTGAIMAIERSVELGAIADSGHRLDSEVSSELLNTIFYPGTRLHDMGVIIHNGRIAAAGCQFPMAESEEVDSSLGSRHRAALGLSKDSDAIVLVVSEETGRISLACDGQLQVGINIDDLKEFLLTLLNVPRTSRSSAGVTS